MKQFCIAVAGLLALILGTGISKATDTNQHWIVFTDGAAIYKVDRLNPGVKIAIVTPPKKAVDITYEYPFVVRGKALWFDRTELRGNYGQRLFRCPIKGGADARMTSDRWGNSSDWMPVVSPYGGCIFHTDRTGQDNLAYSSNGQLGPGYGHTLNDYGAVCWGLTKTDKNIAYMGSYSDYGIFPYPRGRLNPKNRPDPILYSTDGSLALSPDRLSVTTDKRFLISDGNSMYYLIPGQNAVELSVTNGCEGFINQDGTKITYTVYTATQQSTTNGCQKGYQIFSADIDRAGNLSNTIQVITGCLKNSYYECWPSWYD